MSRPPRLKEIRLFDGWVVVNILFQAAYDVLVLLFLGPKAFLFLGAAFFFSVGPHPLGARWIQEHYLVAPPQDTYSYYGPANVVALNVGYHNEHHDAPAVAWNRLPALRRAAPELYDSLVSHRSWTRLFWRFLTDRNLSLWSRVVREIRTAHDEDAVAGAMGEVLPESDIVLVFSASAICDIDDVIISPYPPL